MLIDLILHVFILLRIIMLLDYFIVMSIIELEINCIIILLNSVVSFNHYINAQCFANQRMDFVRFINFIYAVCY